MDIAQAPAWVRFFTYCLATEFITILWIITNDNPGNVLSDMHKICMDGNKRCGRDGKGFTQERYPKKSIIEN